MKVTTEKPEPGVTTLTVEVPPEDLERALDQAWRRVAARVNIPGFRRGKAPRPLVERHVGPAAINEEALRRLLPERYDQAVEQAGIQPIERPQFDIVQFERGKPLVFRATVAVRPTVELGDYRTLAVEPEPVTLNEDEVHNVVERLREAQAQWIPVEDRGAQVGDQIIADLTIEFPDQGEGRPARTSRRQDVEIVLGNHAYPPGFDEQVQGARPGETREFVLSWPWGPAPGEPGAEAGAAPEMRSAQFTVTVKDIKQKQLPALDDAFARSVGDFESLPALLEDVRRRLRQEAVRSARVATENKVVNAVIERSTFEIPQRLIELETEALANERRQALAEQRMTLERYLAIIGQTEEAWRAELREQAVRQLKARLVLDRVAEQEGITVSADEIREEIERTAQQYGEQAPEVRRILSSDDSRRRIEASLRRHKAIERLVAYAGGYPDGGTAGAEPPAPVEAGGEPAAPPAPAAMADRAAEGSASVSAAPSRGTSDSGAD